MTSLMFATIAQSSADASGAALFAGMGAFMIFVVLVGIVASIFWIWMLIDCLTSSRPSSEKLLWGLIIFFGHLLGAILYLLIARGGRSGAVT